MYNTAPCSTKPQMTDKPTDIWEYNYRLASHNERPNDKHTDIL